MKQILFSALVMGGCALLGCKQDQMRHDAARAEAATRDAGSQAGAELQKAGAKVSTEAKKLNAEAKPAAEDLALTAKIKAKLAAAPRVSAVEIHVDTRDRVVTLSGQVSAATEKDLAESLARHTDGVKTVIDNLEITGSVPGATPASSPGG